ncbi:MAG: hypothetical protein KC544_00915 [Gemmatimonadetes bacterium]|nr:hypothetical protein [Gemmatimonadota bacterium]MCB9505437.1 hypothetical protein [Gemmatimonadales bacterium]MCA9761670.1 hypothetical protein [Gemmatimonadota bacterium]MCA9768272.1 hypothetical protein [Gemmatimonadota bacterium]HPF60608.1 hypothetical protein [Gemmatimonadales bacterium]
MSKKEKKAPRSSSMPTALDQARDELFSHILRCGVLEAAPEHQKEWMDDTMQYIADRYPDLGADELGRVRVLGERFCQPVVKHTTAAEVVESSTDESVEGNAEEPETAEATA